MKTCKKGLHQYDGSQCPECKASARSLWIKSNPRYYDDYYSRNRRSIKAYNAARYAANPDRAKANAIKWRTENPGRLREIVAAWRKKNPAAYLESKHRRRARERGGATEPVTKEHLKMLFDAQDGCCRYCRAPLGKDKNLDHRIPLSRGGSHSPSNVCWSCPSCNFRKNVKTEQEFLNG